MKIRKGQQARPTQKHRNKIKAAELDRKFDAGDDVTEYLEMNNCEHSFIDRTGAVEADGFCPLCLAAENKKLRIAIRRAWLEIKTTTPLIAGANNACDVLEQTGINLIDE